MRDNMKVDFIAELTCLIMSEFQRHGFRVEIEPDIVRIYALGSFVGYVILHDDYLLIAVVRPSRHEYIHVDYVDFELNKLVDYFG